MPNIRTLKLTKKQKAELIRYRVHDKRPFVRERCGALLKVAEGQSALSISQTGLLKRRKSETLYKWLNLYEKGGIEELTKHQQGGSRKRDTELEKKNEIKERLKRPPERYAKEELERAPELIKSTPTRWTLLRIRDHFPFLSHWTLSGVWRFLKSCNICLPNGRPQMFSPDPEYLEKEKVLLEALAEVASSPEKKGLVFLDELTYYHWPLKASDWAFLKEPAPLAEKAGTNKYTRIVGVLDALTGKVTFKQVYKIDKEQMIKFLITLSEVYSEFEKVYVVVDNWSVHTDELVQESVEILGLNVELLYLPTYSPWLNPIEKLWDWLKANVIKRHRLAGHWEKLKTAVANFLEQFEDGSQYLLYRVGLKGEGKLAQAIIGDT